MAMGGKEMTIFQAIILGIVQGLTEFLPISSSGHLVLLPHLFNWNIPQDQVFVFDMLIQAGTLVAVILYFWKDLWSIFTGWFSALFNKKPFGTHEAKLGWLLILATIPGVIGGLFLDNLVESAFSSAKMTVIFLAITAILLSVGEWLGNKQRNLEELNWIDALTMGLFQVLALFPGISRSGSTITGGLLRNLDRASAARFSFLMSVPIMLGASIVTLFDIPSITNSSSFIPALIVGFLVAGAVGYLSIRWLLHYLSNHSLGKFSIYLMLVCIVSVLFVL
jgi:undecaprenyl-diphosphatase